MATPQEENPNRVGRPQGYKPEYADQAEKLCKLGATDHELAEFFEVDTSTIYRWKNSHVEFCEAVKIGKDRADDRVERALYNRAVGYTYEAEKVFQYQGEVVRAKTLEHVPPDVGAAFNWLKNRRKDEWRDRVQQEISGPDGGPIETRSETPRDILLARIDALAARAAKDGTDQ